MRHTCAVTDMSFHPSGALLATSDAGGCVHVCNAKGQEVVRDGVHIGIGPATGVAFTPDGASMYVRSDTGVCLYETATYGCLGVAGGSVGHLTHVACASDSTVLATSDEDGTAQMFMLDGTQYPTVSAWLDTACVMVPTSSLAERCDAHTQGALQVAFSADAHTLATVFTDGTLKVWDAITGALVHAVEGEGVVSCVFVPDSNVAVLGLLAVLRVYDYKQGKAVATLPAFTGLMDQEDGRGIRHLCLAPDSRTVHCVVRSRVDSQLLHKCYAFDIESRTRCAAYALHTDEITGVGCISADALVTAARDRVVRVWSTATQSERSAAALPSPAVCISVSGTVIVVGTDCGAAVVLTFEAELLVVRRVIRPWSGGATPVVSCALFGAGHYVAAASDDHSLTVYDVDTTQCVASVQTVGAPTSVAVVERVRRHSTCDEHPPRICTGGSTGYILLHDFLTPT